MDVGDAAFDFVFARNVERAEPDARRIAERIGERGQSFGIAVDERDARAFAEDALGSRVADAAGGAGDDDGMVIETHACLLVMRKSGMPSPAPATPAIAPSPTPISAAPP